MTGDDPRMFGIHQGVVVDNADPKGFGRVRVAVPGLTPDDGGAWAWPITVGGGSAQRGVWHVPDIGAEAYLFFLGGDPDKPRYLGGHWGAPGGASEAPTPVIDADAADRPKIKVWETERFAIVFDERAGKERAYLYTKARGEDLAAGAALMLELDDANGVVAISAPAGIVIHSQGLIDINAMRLQLNGRTVLPIDKPI